MQKIYSEKFKKTIALEYSSQNVSSRFLSRKYNISKSSVISWGNKYKEIYNNPLLLYNNLIKNNHIEIIDCLMSYKAMDDETIGAYCRQLGIFREDLEGWIETMTKDKDLEKSKKLEQENKVLNKKISELEKSLAETKALLELKKKVDQLLSGKKDS